MKVWPLLLLLLLPATAGANPVAPTQIASGDISEVRLALGGGEVDVAFGAREGIGVRSRSALGVLGPTEMVSAGSNPEELLRLSGGNLFLGWRGGYAWRSGGWSENTSPCSGRQSAARLADGDLLLACSDGDHLQILRSSPPGPFQQLFLVEGVGLVEDIRLSVASDGTEALAWRTDQREMQARIGPGWAESQTISLGSGGSPRLAALPGGKAALLWADNGLWLSLADKDGVVVGPIAVSEEEPDSYTLLHGKEELQIAWSISGKTKVATFRDSLSPAVSLSGNFSVGEMSANSRGDLLLPAIGERSLAAWLRPAGTQSFSAPQTFYSGQGIGGATMKIEDDGNVSAAWTGGGVFLGGLDFVPPQIADFTVPTSLLVGQSGDFSALATDSNGIRNVEWNFGDGSTKIGQSVSHRYSEPGSYETSLRAEDRAGRETTRRATVIVRPVARALAFQSRFRRNNVFLRTRLEMAEAGRVKVNVRFKNSLLCRRSWNTVASSGVWFDCPLGRWTRERLRKRRLRLDVEILFFSVSGLSARQESSRVVPRRR